MRFNPYLLSWWALLHENQDVGSVQDIILLFYVWCESRDLGGRGELKIFLYNPSSGNLEFMDKILERQGSILPSSFYGQLPDCYSHVFSFIYSVDEFSFKEVKTWGQSKISSYCFVFGVNQEN